MAQKILIQSYQDNDVVLFEHRGEAEEEVIGTDSQEVIKDAEEAAVEFETEEGGAIKTVRFVDEMDRFSAVGRESVSQLTPDTAQDLDRSMRIDREVPRERRIETMEASYNGTSIQRTVYLRVSRTLPCHLALCNRSLCHSQMFPARMHLPHLQPCISNPCSCIEV